MRRFAPARTVKAVLAVSPLLLTVGCTTLGPAPSADLPRELNKVGQPPYVIEPPDLLQIDLLYSAPKPSYRIHPLDVLGVFVPEAVPAAPIAGSFTVESNGTIYLGAPYGFVQVVGMTREEAREAIKKHLVPILKAPEVSLSLVQTRATQQVRGPHLVAGDGTVNLGVYGSVSVLGQTLKQAKQTLEQHLQDYFQDPEISVNVVGYNSKVYYMIFDYGGAGQQVLRFPLTGNETVLDGVSQTQGLPTVADTCNIWVSRPRTDDCCTPQVLPVDWKAITEQGDTRTNYQLLPGDRVFVKAYRLVEVDNKVARFLSPIERFLGVVLLGSSTVNSIRTDPNLVNTFR